MTLAKRLPLFDIHPVAYLEYKGVPPILTKQGTRVVFEVPATEKTYELLQEYQSNPSIPLLDYVTILRRLRARMLETRDANGKRGPEMPHGKEG